MSVWRCCLALVASMSLSAGCGRIGFDSMPTDAAVDPGPDAAAMVSCPAAGCTVTTGWTKSFGGTGVDYGFKVAVGVGDTLLLTGFFSGASQDFGGGPVPGNGVHDAMVVKFNADGGHIFSRAVGGPGFNEGFGVAEAPGGDVLITGHSEGLANFGGADLPGLGTEDQYVARYDANGNHRWSIVVGGTEADDARAVAADSQGNAYAIGVFNGTANYGGADVVSNGDRDVVVTSYTVDGSHRWTKAFGSVGGESGRGLSVNSATAVVYVSGHYSGPMTVGGVNFPHDGGEDGYLIALDAATGAYLWHLRWGSALNDGSNSIARDSAGNLYVATHIAGPATIAGKALDSTGDEDLVIVSLSAGGDYRWHYQIESAAYERALGIAVGPSGEVVVTGIFAADFQVGETVVVNAGDRDILVFALDPAGRPLWARGYGGPDLEESHGVAVDSLGRVFLTGRYTATALIAGVEYNSVGSGDTFVVRLDPEYLLP